MGDRGQGEENVEDQAWRLSITLSSACGENHYAKMMLVGAGARFLFYPTLLYNVIRNKLEPGFRWWDEIDQFLLLGAVPFPRDIPRLKDSGVQAVVTLNEPYETLVPSSFYKLRGISHLVIPTRDYLFAPSFDDIRRAVAFIHEHAQRGEKTYVHCKAGRGRSTTIVICYLVQHRGMTPLEALCYVRSKRPRVLLAPSQWQAVQEFTGQIHSRCIQRRMAPTIEKQHAEPLPSCNASEDNPATHAEVMGESAVLVSTKDLLGYRSIEDAGLVGNEYIGVVCKLRLLTAAKNIAGVGKASVAWSKLSCLWINAKAAAATLPSSSSSSCKELASSVYGMEVVVVPPGMVN